MNPKLQIPLGEVAQIERQIVDPNSIKSGTLYVGLENIESGGGFVSVRTIEEGELASSKFAFTRRHLLYGKLRPYLAKVARPNFEGICSTDILPILPGPDLERDYLAWLLLSPQMIAQASARATGANLPRLSPDVLAKMLILLPPHPEQRLIAAILDKADGLRAKRRAALKKLDELTQSIFLDMFGDPGTNPKNWPKMAIGDLTEVAQTWNPGNQPNKEFIYIDISAIDQGKKQITAARNVLGKDAPSRARQIVKKGDILVSTVRPNLNAVAQVPEKFDGATVSTGFCVLRPRSGEIISSYLFALVQFKAFVNAMVRQATGASYPAVTDNIVRGWKAPIARYDLQETFENKMKQIMQVKLVYENTLKESNALFASLQYRAFRGEL
jgi:type I restriction enzyme, S subunit